MQNAESADVSDFFSWVLKRGNHIRKQNCLSDVWLLILWSNKQSYWKQLPKAHTRVSVDYMLQYEVHHSKHFSSWIQTSSTVATHAGKPADVAQCVPEGSQCKLKAAERWHIGIMDSWLCCEDQNKPFQLEGRDAWSYLIFTGVCNGAGVCVYRKAYVKNLRIASSSISIWNNFQSPSHNRMTTVGLFCLFFFPQLMLWSNDDVCCQNLHRHSIIC